MLTLFVFVFLAAGVGPAVTPSVSIVSQLHCGNNRFAVLQVSNPSQQSTMHFPLSGIYTRGFTIHDIRLEIDDGQWRLVGRPLDTPAVGIRDLKPGERFVDLFELPGPGTDLATFRMLLLVPYRISASSQQVKTNAFRISELPVKSDVVCPALPNWN